MATRPWMARLAAAGLIANGVYWIAELAIRSGMPGNYYQFRNSAEGFVYPTQSVVTWSAVIAAEVVLAVLALARTKTVPGMCLVLGLLYGLAVLALGIFAMHAPPYFGGHLVFLVFGGAWLLVMWMVTGLASLRHADSA